MPANATLDDIVLNIRVFLDAQSVSRAGFGTLLIVGPNFAPGDGSLIGFFNSLPATLVGTGLTDSTPEYRAARDVFSQKVNRLAIGRLRARVAQVSTITVGTQADGTWTVTVNGTNYTFPATGSATVNAIAAGLRSALGSVPGVTVSGSNANIVLTANVAGVGFTATVAAPAGGAATVAATTANRSVAGELDAILNENPDWFGLVITSRTAEDLRQASAWAEASNRLFGGVTADAAVLSSAEDDIASELNATGRTLTALAYHLPATEELGAAWLGRVLSFDLERKSPTYANHNLVGMTPDAMTATQRDNAQRKKCNVYLKLKGVPATSDGVTVSGKYIDEVVISHWLKARIEEDIAQVLLDLSAKGEKLPFTDAGFAVIENIVRRRYLQGVEAKHFSPDQFEGNFPRRSAISAQDVAERRYTWSARIQLAGAIHRVASDVYLTSSAVI